MADSDDSNRQIAWRVLTGAVRSSVREPGELRYHAIRDSWSAVKRLGATGVENVELREVPCLRDAVVEGYIDDPNRVALAALCKGIGAQSFFEIGTNRGRTTWTVARHSPELELYTLDLPSRESVDDVELDLNASDRDFFVGEWDRGEAFADSPEAERITQVWGDSASFDFEPYRDRIDLVFIDGAHSYSYVRNDTAAALGMLREGGAVVWDDYPGIPGVYRFLQELGPTLSLRPFHILGTRMAVYSTVPLVERVGDAGRGRLYEA